MGEQGIRRESTYQVKQKHSPSSLEWDLDSNMISRKTEKVEAQSSAISKLLHKCIRRDSSLSNRLALQM